MTYQITQNSSAVYQVRRNLTAISDDAIILYVDGNSLGEQLPYNSVGMPYPNIVPYGLNKNMVPFPDDGRAFIFCGTGSIFTTLPGACVKRGRPIDFNNSTNVYYLSKGYFVPPVVTGKYENHHVHPLCWGGDESGSNGSYLTNRLNGGEHARFTSWWRFFLTGCPSYGTLPDIYPLDPE